MYAYLKGTLIEATMTDAIVEVHGVGYCVSIPSSLFGQLPQIGENVRFFTSFVIRENSQALYGFLTQQEKELFEILLNVSGIGPKLALALIGNLSLAQLQTALLQNDVKLLCRVPGVGKKTAERLVVELKDKVGAMAGVEMLPKAIAMPNDPKTKQLQDAVMAMINLGYNQNVAQKAVQQSLNELPDATDLADIITAALRHIVA